MGGIVEIDRQRVSVAAWVAVEERIAAVPVAGLGGQGYADRAGRRLDVERQVVDVQGVREVEWRMVGIGQRSGIAGAGHRAEAGARRRRGRGHQRGGDRRSRQDQAHARQQAERRALQGLDLGVQPAPRLARQEQNGGRVIGGQQGRGPGQSAQRLVQAGETMDGVSRNGAGRDARNLTDDQGAGRFDVGHRAAEPLVEKTGDEWIPRLGRDARAQLFERVCKSDDFEVRGGRGAQGAVRYSVHRRPTVTPRGVEPLVGGISSEAATGDKPWQRLFHYHLHSRDRDDTVNGPSWRLGIASPSALPSRAPRQGSPLACLRRSANSRAWIGFPRSAPAACANPRPRARSAAPDEAGGDRAGGVR